MFPFPVYNSLRNPSHPSHSSPPIGHVANTGISKQKFYTKGHSGSKAEPCVKRNCEKQISVINALFTLEVKIDFRPIVD